MDDINQNTSTNINTVAYWNNRFASGDWANKGGFSQTHQFAATQIPLLNIAKMTTERICDFGCGAGDAFPLYRETWRSASLLGIDFSAAAIALCRQRYGDIAEFICGDVTSVPCVDTIICSNVLEHLDDDKAVVSQLLNRCNSLKVIVPYKSLTMSIH
jgi:2-polyprenyl-3-methyl-5-hydroxy-6-metoxy-1,4-benzoquinol methylase